MEKYGDTFEVLVLSQAVQADSKLTAQEMLDAEFGQITEQTDFAKLFANVK